MSQFEQNYSQILNPCLVAEDWFSYKPLYIWILENYLKDGMRIAEVGVFMGKSCIWMANEIKQKGFKDVKMFAVDHFQGSPEHQPDSHFRINELIDDKDFILKTFQVNVEKCGVQDVINTVRMDSVSAAASFPDEYFDFVLLDAGHNYEDVKRDIQAWYPKVKMGGILGGDDYHRVWGGVVKAVDEAFGNESNDLKLGYWLTKKQSNDFK